jgi:hypothetical protein
VVGHEADYWLMAYGRGLERRPVGDWLMGMGSRVRGEWRGE